VLEWALVDMDIVGEGVVGDVPPRVNRSSDDILEGVRKSEQMLLIVASDVSGKDAYGSRDCLGITVVIECVIDKCIVA